MDVDMDLFDISGEFINSVNDKTDANGDYAMGALPPGSYLLRADPEPETFLAERFYIDGDSRGTATPIEVVGTSNVTGIDIELAGGGLISGTVRDADTLQPVEGIDLDLFNAAGDFQDAGGTSSPTGAFEIG